MSPFINSVNKNNVDLFNFNSYFIIMYISKYISVFLQMKILMQPGFKRNIYLHSRYHKISWFFQPSDADIL